jgi:toxin ParE1/3/4
MSKLRLSAHAKADLSDVWFYIAQDNSAAADAFIASLLGKMDLLAQSPRLGRRRDELRPGLRSFPVGNYVIFYRRADRGIEVVRVLSRFRDVASFF